MEGGFSPREDYVRIEEKRYAPRTDNETSEGRFWRSFKSPNNIQQIGPVTSINFCPSSPHDFAVTSSTRVITHSSGTGIQKRVFSRFSDVAYSGGFRQDGQLLVAGGESGIVQIFDAGSRAVLRQLKGHNSAVHAAQYCEDKVHVLSTGDDRTVRWWDVPTQAGLLKLEGHTDYVRCAAASPAMLNLWASGSYDHTVRLWDLRSAKCVMSLQHSTPLEDVIFFPGGSMMASAGGTYVCIWDMLTGGRLLQRVTNYQKTVTCLDLVGPSRSNSPADRTPGPRLLTGSLDGHVKVHSFETFQVLHSIRYPAPVLAVGISPDARVLAVGTASGLLSIRLRTAGKRPERDQGGAGPMHAALHGRSRRRKAVMVPKPGTLRYFMRGQSAKAAAADHVVSQARAAHLGPHDRLLRHFRYAQALSAVLQLGSPPLVIAVMEDLVARRGLRAALSNRDAASLEPVLAFVTRHVGNPRYSGLMIQVANTLVALYGASFGLSSSIDHQIKVLREKVKEELHLALSLVALQGLLQPLVHKS